MEIHDPSVTPQQRATLIGTLLMMDYMAGAHQGLHSSTSQLNPEPFLSMTSPLYPTKSAHVMLRSGRV